MSPESIRPWLRKNARPLLFLSLVLFTTGFVRLRLAGTPLERDEGEYAFAGRLIRSGVSPYLGAYTMKLPGTALAYAAVMSLFGETPFAIHVGLMLVNLASVLLVFGLASGLWNVWAGARAALFFACLSLDIHSFGFTANAEPFAVFFVLVGVALLFIARRKKNAALWVTSGGCFGAAFLCKQPALTFLLAALLATGRDHSESQSSRRFRNALKLGMGAAIPYVAVLLVTFCEGSFTKFWLWTVRYAAAYGAQVDPVTGLFGILPGAFSASASASAGFWVLAALGAIVCLRRPATPTARSLLLFFGASFLALCAGFHFREHYFLFLSPVAALLGAAAIEWARGARRLARFGRARAAVPFLLVAVPLAIFLGKELDYLFILTPEQVVKRAYGMNPFVESVEIGDYVRRHCSKEDRVAVLGSEPQIYFYSGCRAATGYIYTYALMEHQPFAVTMQQEMIEEIEAAKPTLLLFVSHQTSWLKDHESVTLLFDWLARYLNEYDLVGLVESSPEAYRSFWESDLPKAVNGPDVPSIRIYRRRKS